MLNEPQLCGSLEDRVKSALEAVADNLRGMNAGNKLWTLQIKSQLKEKRPDDCQVFATGHSGEFLYDLIWIRREQGQRPILDLALVLECEWGIGQEIFDFQKLLLARADLRVMVFQGSRQHQSQVIAQMRDEISEFRKTQTGDRYLFACWDLEPECNHREFHYEGYVVPSL
jgi:hypothetical protein